MFIISYKNTSGNVWLTLKMSQMQLEWLFMYYYTGNAVNGGVVSTVC